MFDAKDAPRSGSPNVKNCQQLDRLKLAIDQKWLELANRKGVAFHQDNARSHTSLVIRQKIWELGTSGACVANRAINGVHGQRNEWANVVFNDESRFCMKFGNTVVRSCGTAALYIAPPFLHPVSWFAVVLDCIGVPLWNGLLIH
ncbi:hypothetical protein TNCV_5097371 [Trichonephila clavipes]|nr:hypothetical protein TNCV_5097371 [Trichonephila clavipes]